MRMCHIIRTCHAISTDVSHFQYGGECAVLTCHIISTVEGVQYGSVTSSVGTARGGGGGSWWLHLSGESDILETTSL